MITPRRPWLFGFLATLTAGWVVFTGCRLTQPYPAKQSYLLEWKTESPRSAVPTGTVLELRSVRVVAPFEGQEWVYRLSDSQYEVDFYREFLVAPRDMFTALLRQWAGESGLFAAVTTPGGALAATDRLEVWVTALYGDWRERSSPKAVLGLQFRVIRREGAAPWVRLEKTYREAIPVPDQAPDHLVQGWNTGLQRILQRLQQDWSAGSAIEIPASVHQPDSSR